MTEFEGVDPIDQANRALDRIVDIFFIGPNKSVAKEEGVSYFRSKLIYARSLGEHDLDFSRVETKVCAYVLIEASIGNWKPMRDELLELSEELKEISEMEDTSRALGYLAESLEQAD